MFDIFFVPSAFVAALVLKSCFCCKEKGNSNLDPPEQIDVLRADGKRENAFGHMPQTRLELLNIFPALPRLSIGRHTTSLN